MSKVAGEAPKHSGLKEKAIEELKIFWIITFYLFLLIGTFMIYRRLLLAELRETGQATTRRSPRTVSRS